MCSPEHDHGHGVPTITTKTTKATKEATKGASFDMRAKVSFVSSFVLLVVFVVFVVLVASRLVSAQPSPSPAGAASRQQVLDTMKRATIFMVEKVSTNGGYVWSYLPDFSRRWGELEARPTMVWIQPPGTPTMGHLFLDAYHATGDEYYYQAAEKVADVLALGQHASGGWNYVVDLAGEESLKQWYETVGRNAWRLEELQHYWGNATFDDAGTAEAAKFFLRLYVEKGDRKYKAPLDKAVQFILQSQYRVGAWPQRFPLTRGMLRPDNPDYTSYLTFNDDVAAENIDFLVMCYTALGETRLLEPIGRAMNAFLVTQQRRPQAGWALQYTTDLRPAGARTYEPKALVTHTTAANIELLVKFYMMTGEQRFLARIPEALDWLEGLTLPPGIAPPGRTHPTFVELGTNRPLYVHREGSNAVNGRYFYDYDPKNTIVHYSSFRRIDVPRLRKLHEEAKALTSSEASKGSPLVAGASLIPLPRYAAVTGAPGDAASVIADLDRQGRWLAPLGTNSHPYRGESPRAVAPGDYSQTHVGDAFDTSPYPDDAIVGISTATYIRNMNVLIRALENPQPKNPGGIR